MPVLLVLLTLPASAQELTTATVDAGGSLTSGGDVEVAGSFGTFGDVSVGDDTTARAGFPGQVFDPASVAITPGGTTIAENDSATFTATVVCDDGTLLDPDSTLWSLDSALLSVTAHGEVTAGLLPGSFEALLTATASGVSGTAIIRARDVDSDNFAPYAGDGLPDDWQMLYFGLNHPDAAPSADPDDDGQNNQTEFLAGTDPLDAASLLQLRFGPDPSPGTKTVIFTPFLPDRTYTLEWSASLAAPWTARPEMPVPAAVAGEGEFTHAAAEPRTFYRLRITVP